LKKYEQIMAYFNSNPAPILNWEDEHFLLFKRTYNHFYRVRRNEEFQKRYFQLLFENDRDCQFGYLLEEIYKQTNRLEASFASKMMHTLNPEMPIWDAEVLKKVKVNAPKYWSSNRKSETILCYKHIQKWYNETLTSGEGKSMLAIFNSKCGAIKITDLKKIDFMLWQQDR
ncbi:MAG: hypothetical protein ABIP68_00970, partial [Ferruginibacter sp.]